MSVEPRDNIEPAGDGAARIVARAASADASARARMSATIEDVFLPADARLDDRARAALLACLTALADAIAGELSDHAARLLRARGDRHADALAAPPATVIDRLLQAGLPRDADFMRELVARTGQDLLSAALPAAVPDDADRPSLLPRLTDHADRVVAGAAMAVLVADNRRRAPFDASAASRTDLPAEQHHRLVWWVAAILRERHATGDAAALDRALAEAAIRNLAAHDEGERLEAASLRLAVALDADADTLPDVLVEALSDRRVALFAALLAHGLGIAFDAAREIVLDPDGSRLWLALRALDLPRDAIARIGLALGEGDPRRDLDAFADTLDEIAAVPVATARAALAPLRLHPDYRAALAALGSRA